MESWHFRLDLSGNTGIPSQYKITLKEIIKWMKVQAKGLKDLKITPDWNSRGCYTFSTVNPTTGNFLCNFSLEINWSGKTHRVPLKRVTPGRPKTKVRFLYTTEGEMEHIPNSYFDDILERAGFTLIVPTTLDTHFDSDYYNGNRWASVMRTAGHAEREHTWTGAQGHVYQWKLIYDGQPFDCRRGCQKWHDDGVCPRFEKMKERRSYEGQQKTFFVGSSLLRYCSDTKEARVDSIPGAKVGHVAQHINNDATIFQKAEVLVVHAGANMDYGAIETSKSHLEDQARELVQVVKPLVESDKKVFVVDPVAGPLVKEAPGADHWAMVRARMKRAAKEMKADWISLEHLQWNRENDIAEDGVHYSPSGTKKMMETVAARIKSSTGRNVIEGMDFTDRPYENIYRNHYKYGCYRCTRIHPRGTQCPPLSDAALNLSITGPNNNSSSNSADSFHSVNNANSGLEGSEESLKLSDGPRSPGGCTARDVLLAVTRSHLHPNHALTAPVSAAVAAAAAATSSGEGLTLQSRLSSGSPIPMDPRSRSSSQSKRGRMPSDEASGQKDPNGKRPKDSGQKPNAHQSRLSLEKNGKK